MLLPVPFDTYSQEGYKFKLESYVEAILEENKGSRSLGNLDNPKSKIYKPPGLDNKPGNHVFFNISEFIDSFVCFTFYSISD